MIPRNITEKLKVLGDKALFYLSAPKCPSCNERLSSTDKALCQNCENIFSDIKLRNCSRCAKILSECSCTNNYLERHFVKTLIKVFRYNQRDENLPANALIYSLKRDNRNDVIDRCAEELTRAIKSSVASPEDCIVTNVPRRRAAIIRHGIDHSAMLAKAVASLLNAEYLSLLTSKAKRAQKELSHNERLKNAGFDIKSDLDLSKKRVILIDDIVTTGASMGASATMIRSLGSKQIIGATLAIAYKDEYESPIKTKY